MNFVPYEANVKMLYQKTRNQEILNAFANSEYECVRITNWDHKDASSCASSLKQTIKRLNMFHIEVFVRNGEVILLKNFNK